MWFGGKGLCFIIIICLWIIEWELGDIKKWFGGYILRYE